MSDDRLQPLTASAGITYQPSHSLAYRVEHRLSWLASRRPHALHSPTGIVSFTFDDFDVSAATWAGRSLEACGVWGTFYVSMGLVGQRASGRSLLSPDHVTLLHAAGHEIACHTYSHLDLAKWSAEEAIADIGRNRLALQACLENYEPENFAYPYGRTNRAAKRALRSCFRSLRGVSEGLNVGTLDLALLKSCALTGGRAGLERYLGMLQATMLRQACLIFYTHDVGGSYSEIGCSGELFDELLKRALDLGLSVLSIRDALAAIGVERH